MKNEKGGAHLNTFSSEEVSEKKDLIEKPLSKDCQDVVKEETQDTSHFVKRVGSFSVRAVFRSIAMCFSLFSVIPMPRVDWEQHNMSSTLAALPLVGLVIGLLQVVWALVANYVGFGPMLTGAVMLIIALLVSGGIHMDGFCDTIDALSAHVEPKRAREIMKDSLTGAFAVIYTAAYLLVFWALYTECAQDWCSMVGLALVDGEVVGGFFGIISGAWSVLIFCVLLQMVSRALGALASVVFPSASSSGMQSMLKKSAGKSSSGILVGWMLLCAGLGVIFCGGASIVAFAVGILELVHIKYLTQKRFGGMSGDVAGFLITVSQPVMLFVFLLANRLVGICF